MGLRVMAALLALLPSLALAVTKEFQAKPGSGTSTAEITNENGITCTFTFACNGGTGETWEMYMDDGPSGTCVAYNLSGDGVSYLYFDFAKIHVKDPKSTEAIEVVSAHTSPGESSMFDVTPGGAESNKNFGHEINKFGVEFHGKHEEL